jgi:hypothetical protein
MQKSSSKQRIRHELHEKFKKDGHKFTIDTSFSKNLDNDSSTILGTNARSRLQSDFLRKDNQRPNTNRNIIQADYVLPFGKGSQLKLKRVFAVAILSCSQTIGYSRTPTLMGFSPPILHLPIL